MKAAQTIFMGTGRSGKYWKGLGLGASALGLACLGCCLAPILGIFLTAGTGAVLAGSLRSWVLPAILGSLTLAMLIFLTRKTWRISCCPSPDSDCRTGSCGIHTRRHGKESMETTHASIRNQRVVASEPTAIIPDCRLSPATQVVRIGQIRSGFFRDIDSIDEGKGGLRLQFADKPETVRELIDFIRFERECCTSLRFGLEWKPNGGPVTLEMRGPAPLLKAMKEAAGESLGRP